MSIQAARAFHERAFSDNEFRRAVEAKGREGLQFLNDIGYAFDVEHWRKLQQTLKEEQAEAALTIENLSQGDITAALNASRNSLAKFPLSWQLLDLHVAVLGHCGAHAECKTFLRELYADHPRLVYLDGPQRQRALDILGATFAFALAQNPELQKARDLATAGPTAPTAGGWSMTLKAEVWPDRHQVAVVACPTVEDFAARFAYRNRPVLLQGLTDDWSAKDTWRRDPFLKTHGQTTVQVHPARDVVENLRTGQPTEQMLMSDYATQMSARGDVPYIFKGLDSAAIAADFDEPDQFAAPLFSNAVEKRHERTFFYLGPAGSGVGFHQHVAAWNALVYGYKIWFFIPPHAIQRYRNANITALAFSDDVPEEIIKCVQCQGEVLFVPQYWHHATYNLTDCIGVAREIGTIDNLPQRLRDALSLA